MLGQRRRRWANIELTQGQCPAFAAWVYLFIYLFGSPNIVELTFFLRK